MSVTTPRTLPRRVEPVLLPLLREEFPDVVFSSIRSRDNPPRECVIIGEPGQKATPGSQYVRLRVSVWVRRDDGAGDIDAAQKLAAGIESYLTGPHPPRPVVTIGHESGPMRMTDENGCLMAYLVLLLTVETN